MEWRSDAESTERAVNQIHRHGGAESRDKKDKTPGQDATPGRLCMPMHLAYLHARHGREKETGVEENQTEG